MKIYLFTLILALLSACSTTQKKGEVKNWKKASSDLAKSYANSMGELYPEYISDIGFSKFDPRTTPFSRELESKRYALSYKWKKRLERFIAGTSHPELKTDAQILLENANLEMESVELARKEAIVPFLPISEYVFGNLKSLIKTGASKTKIHSALIKFRSYVRGTDTQLPLIDGYMSYLLSRLDQMKENRQRGHWPTRKEIISYIKESDEYLKGIEKLLEVWPAQDWQRDFKELKNQDLNYRAFLKKKILPYARTTNRTPPEVYAFMLKEYGIFDPPAKLIADAKEDYQKTYGRFREIGKDISLANSLSDSEPLTVAKFLSSKRFKDDDELLKYYRFTTNYLMDLVKKNNLLTIEEKPDFIIRFGSPAEMQSIPAPHFDSPALLGKDLSPGQYVIPRTSGNNGMPDYSFKEAIVNLTSHEGIPGHALQYQIMKERGTTLIRAKLAFNSANVEGWAHYAEEIVFPYLTKEEQFITLQRRLWRQARMFLDPELNLGKIDSRRVLEVYIKELGFSPEFAASELKRYSYIMPGQAPAYYYGYKVLADLKIKLKEKLKRNFTEKCFNDALLDLGVLPLKVISDRMANNLNCGGK